MRVHHLNNVNKALQILEQNNVSFITMLDLQFEIFEILFFILTTELT